MTTMLLTSHPHCIIQLLSAYFAPFIAAFQQMVHTHIHNTHTHTHTHTRGVSSSFVSIVVQQFAQLSECCLNPGGRICHIFLDETDLLT